MIKYLGSKRVLVPYLGLIADALGTETAADVFTGTTRVAQEFKRRGAFVTALDLASYSHLLARCFIERDAAEVDRDALQQKLDYLNGLPARPGYFTREFCEEARFFQPKNGARIDAIREALAQEFEADVDYPILLTALLLAADRVDSTTGLQMAYLKSWAPRASNDLELRMPQLLPGGGRAIWGDATIVAGDLPEVDLAYLDPPYNQHRYYSNYHIWESLVRWDKPPTYGIAHKREDNRDPDTKSAFNSRSSIEEALAAVISQLKARTVVLSYNDESWLGPDDIVRLLAEAGHDTVSLLEFDNRRYVGASIGIYNPSGEKVGKISHTRNRELVFVAGTRAAVETAVQAVNLARVAEAS